MPKQQPDQDSYRLVQHQIRAADGVFSQETLGRFFVEEGQRQQELCERCHLENMTIDPSACRSQALGSNLAHAAGPSLILLFSPYPGTYSCSSPTGRPAQQPLVRARDNPDRIPTQSGFLCRRSARISVLEAPPANVCRMPIVKIVTIDSTLTGKMCYTRAIQRGH